MNGFLPKNAPAKSYSMDSHSCSRIEEICNNLPKLLLTGNVQKTIDKLSKKNIIHANKAANLKSKLARHIAAL